MTLDYKILGQLYYGPEINETPEIPGTSGYYTYTTGSLENRFVLLVNNRNQGITSVDGITWSAANLAFPQSRWSSIAYGDGKFIAVSLDSSPSAALSTDGINWNSILDVPNAIGAAITYGDGKFVTVTRSSNIGHYSTDGVTWTSTTLPSSKAWIAVSYGNGKFVATSENNSSASAYSTDGINWTEGSLPSIGNWRMIVYGGGRFVALSSQNSAYSTDGINWTQSTIPSLNWTGLTYGNNKFVAVAYGSQAIYYSSDGLTWSTTTAGELNLWSSLVYGDGKFVALQGFSTSSAYSTDGINWNIITTPYLDLISVVLSPSSFGQVNTLTEVQISIGGQGTPGSYVEIIEPQIVYTVPAGTEATITSIFVTNHDSVERTFDLAVVPAGEELSLKHHIRWDMPVSATDFDLINSKITMSAGDKIYVFPSTINKVGFTLFGVEKS